MYDNIDTPAVIIDMDAVEKNIRDMLRGAAAHGLAHRPHIKTHKCVKLAKMQLAAGASGITCAKLGEAEVMAEAGINNILVAYPLIGKAKAERYVKLHRMIAERMEREAQNSDFAAGKQNGDGTAGKQNGDVVAERQNSDFKGGLLTIINSVEGAEGLAQAAAAAGDRLDVLIEVDGGTRRGGIAPGRAALEFADKLSGPGGPCAGSSAALSGSAASTAPAAERSDAAGASNPVAVPSGPLHICGLMYYPGANYSEHTDAGIAQAVRRERDDILSTAELLRAHGYDMTVLSGGNTVSSKVPDLLEGLTEVRAGNYIFNDCQQLYFDRVAEEDCALRVLATVVCKTGPNDAILDAGTKSLSSDVFHGTDFGYGRIAGHPAIRITNLNEEHAFIHSDEPLPLNIGDRVQIIPNHACVVPNLVRELWCVRGGVVEGTTPVDARGISY